ncbi:MAG: DUF2064 domain-containing protein [Solirubrobacteraceae bacterium]
MLLTVLHPSIFAPRIRRRATRLARFAFRKLATRTVPGVDRALIVIAKEPRAGRVKTRLSPPLDPAQAASLAEAALADTLASVRLTPACRHILVLDGAPGPWLPEGFTVIAQRGGDLARRLAGAFADVGGPALLVGMDTPQLTPALLAASLDELQGSDAVLGLAPDGGFWAIGLRRADERVFDGIPMSRSDTGARQLARITALGLRCKLLTQLRDFDTYGDAAALAELAPDGRFAARFLELAA